VTVDVELHESLVEIFTQAVMKEADLPEARQDDVQEASTFSSKGGEILCTCDITGSTYSEPGTGPRPQRRPLRRKWVKRRPPWLRARRKTTSTPGSTPAGSPPFTGSAFGVSSRTPAQSSVALVSQERRGAIHLGGQSAIEAGVVREEDDVADPKAEHFPGLEASRGP